MVGVSVWWRYADRWLWLIATVGIVYRLRAFSAGRSLWLDETFLAVNLIDRDLWQLLTLPLENNQSAPPGFLALTWLSYQLFGQSDFSVRLLPLLAATVTPIVAILIAKTALQSRLAKTFFVTLVSFSPVLIFYGQEFKQYSIDVLATLLVIYWWANWQRLKRSRWVLLVGATLALLSLTAMLTMVLMCGVLFAQALLAERKTSGTLADWWRVLLSEFRPALIATWLAALLIHVTQTVATTPTGFMLWWWSRRGAFAPVPPETLADWAWYPESFLKLFKLGFESLATVGPEPGIGQPFVWIPGLVLLGMAVWSRAHWLILPGLALLAAYTLAMLQVYPFNSRLALYLLPLLFIALAVAIEPTRRIGRRRQLALAAVPVALLTLITLGYSSYKFVTPVDFRDAKWAIAALNQMAEPDQTLVFDDSTENQLQWYRAQGLTPDIPTIELTWDWENGRYADVAPLTDLPAVWTMSLLAPEPENQQLQLQLESMGFARVCYVFVDSTYLGLYVKAELVESQNWDCAFPPKD